MTSDCILKNHHLSLSVAATGAEMQYLRTSQGADLLWHGDATFWTGRAPVLFPIVGRAPDDRIEIGAHRAEMAQHGFARRRRFALEAHTPTDCHHVLRADAETRALYPFDFALHLTHALDGNTLSVTARVENQSEAPMPFGFGFHPAFNWPIPGHSEDLHHVTLASATNPQQRPLRDDGLLEPTLTPGPFQDGVLPIKEALFKDGALVFPDASEPLRYGTEDGAALSFTFHNLPDIALWKPIGAPFLCVEPWHGTAALAGAGAQIADRPNSLLLPPREVAEFGYSVTVSV
ncbi:aldose 1-epimerase family protein [Shimia sp. R10_1]|uniref:aldose epimerase family protein n=1 Tax=Shimia sp. R10_1 TaxID=2821095 RepID=UPI001ADCEEB5|nr:aldose 1-epimerase family protein [Shimia sp. R10_1]MBO9475020.1 aldose 1-epimerase family protein [Shimia sp. R10_1]